jgi:hypothetical protein
MSKGADGGRAGKGTDRSGRAAAKLGKALDPSAYRSMLENRSRQLNPKDETYESSREGAKADSKSGDK